MLQLNLASQSVLEGLNACLDHRAEIYVPELGRSFQIEHKKTRMFACQNPLKQGGGRKGLPRSFLNRFTQVRLPLGLKSDQGYSKLECLFVKTISSREENARATKVVLEQVYPDNVTTRVVDSV